MRVAAPNGNAALATAASARRAGGGGFTLTDMEQQRPVAGGVALRTVGGIESLLALQGVDDPTERRRQGFKRGRLALDILEELKVGMLGGALSPTVLTRLKAAADVLRASTGDAALDAVLAEIDLRVGVELAKAGVS